MHRYLHTLPLLMILLIPPAFADSPIQVSASPNDSITPFITTDGTNIHVMWTDHSRSGFSDIFFSKSTDGGKTFSPPKTVSDKQGSSIGPYLVANGTDIYAAWTYRYPDNYSGSWSDDNSEVFFSKSTDGGQTFSTPRKISGDSSYAHLPKLVVDGKNVFITWNTIMWAEKLNGYDNMEILFSKSTDGGQTFTEPQNLSNNEGFSDSQAIAAKGANVLVAWSDDYVDNTAIFLVESTDGGQTFNTPKNISDDMRYSDSPTIVAEGSNVFLAWTYQVKGENHDILFSKSTDGGQTFTEPQNLSNTAGFSTMPTMTVDDSNIFVTWADGQTKSSQILFSKSTDGGKTFSPPQTLSADRGFSSSQSVATNGKDIFNVWSWAESSPEDKRVLVFSKSTMVPSSADNGTQKVSDDVGSELPQIDDVVPESNVGNSTSEPYIKNIQWLEYENTNFAVGGIGIIRLDNPELNVNEILIDISAVHVWSDTDTEGIRVDMVETGADTGVFYADISLSGTESSTHQLHVSGGDTMTVSYEDDSLDEPLVDAVKIISEYLPPLRQMASGVVIDEIQCQEGLILAKNPRSGTPICLTPDSLEKLRDRNLIQLIFSR